MKNEMIEGTPTTCAGERVSPFLSEVLGDQFDPHSGMWYDPNLDQCYSKITGPVAVMWDVTNRCNLSCLHCYNQSGTRPPVDDLGTEEMLGIARQILELKPFVVCLCGGEPLIREDILDLISVLRGGVLTVNMVSNGYLLDERKVKALVDAGIGSVQVSLDGVKPETHDRLRACPGSWERAVRAIKALIQEGRYPPVTLIPNKLNYREIEAWGEFLMGLGVYNLRLMPLIPLGRGGRNSDHLMLDGEEDFAVRLAIHRFKVRHPNLLVEWGDPMHHIYNFTAPTNRMKTYSVEIRPDGLLAVTAYMPLLVGDLRKHRLKEYWQAGLDKVWKHPGVLSWAADLHCLYDMKDQKRQPWNNDDVHIPLI